MSEETALNIKSMLISTVSGMILGAVLGAGILFQYITLDHFKVYKTNIGMMVFINDKIYNLSELKSLD